MAGSSMLGRWRFVACLMLGLSLGGCSSWQVQSVTPKALLGHTAPDKVRLTLANGDELVVSHPRLAGDTLGGMADARPVQVPLNSIRRVATRHISLGKSVGLGLGVGLIAFITAAAATMGSMCGLGC